MASFADDRSKLGLLQMSRDVFMYQYSLTFMDGRSLSRMEGVCKPFASGRMIENVAYNGFNKAAGCVPVHHRILTANIDS